MYYSANSGALPNNKNFSPCSKKVMLPLLKLRSRRACFKGITLFIFVVILKILFLNIASTDATCGNGVVEKGEACDSGVESDGCCYMGHENGKTRCTLIDAKACRLLMIK